MQHKDYSVSRQRQKHSDYVLSGVQGGRVTLKEAMLISSTELDVCLKSGVQQAQVLCLVCRVAG